MGPLEDEDNRNDSNSRKNNLNVDSSYVATQQIDSQFSPGDVSEGDEDEDFLYLNNTVPVDDTYLLEDAFETQLMDLAGETQAVDLAGETQVLDDLDCMNDTSMEFLNEFSKSQGANKTQALCETQVLSQDDSVKTNGSGLVGSESKIDIYPPKQGLVFRGFTSIRAASIRASGLAARARGANANLCTTSCEKSSVEQQTCEQSGSFGVGYLLKSDRKNDQECLQNEYNEEVGGLKNLNKYKVGNTAVRKLFGEDKVSEVGQLEADFDHSDDNLDMPELLGNENCMAGLSYVDSQEPGELSQAHALEVVDKFLDLNVVEDDEVFGMRVHKVEKKAKVVSGAKGSVDLAKKSIAKIADGKCGIYDWDDTREDDCGGEFFLKKKELFFDKGCPKQRSLTEPRKPKCNDLGIVKTVGNNGDEKEQKYAKNKLGDPVYSDSGLILNNNVRAKRKSLNCGERVLQKNLIKDLDEELSENDANEDVPKTVDIGPDTQLAAEAMETLCFEVQLPESNSNVPNKVAHITKGASKKRSYIASVGVLTRQAKQLKRTSIGASNEHSPTPELPKRTRKRRNTMPLETESTVQMSEKKRHFEDQLGFAVPVAHRTRKCTKLNRPKATAVNSSINGSTSALIVRKGTAGKDKNAEMLTAEKQYSARSKGSRENGASISLGPVNNGSSKNDSAQRDSDCTNVKANLAETSGRIDALSREKRGTSLSTCVTPANCTTPIKDLSPICRGDEYKTQSCRRNLSRLSLITVIDNSVTGSPLLYGGIKGSRKRKDVTDIRVLFSQHLDLDIVNKQKKILARLGGAVASSMTDGTHFVADEFVRTRNMLEAIALGKPVVTHLWLDSCGQASCLIDEKNYILRDAKKEKEFGFSLPVSLSRACQQPLLQGQKVLVTPNTKPGTHILASLIKAVHGLAVERLGRSVLKDEKLPEDLLILSCEEDYDTCVPFLEKGGAVYSSELLLNGIVKQKLEYERHRLFEDHVKRTRSTVWVKRKNQYLPVSKCK
ncbi:hypothetical protein ABFX02_14G012100 [Erythranthe guttata]